VPVVKYPYKRKRDLEIEGMFQCLPCYSRVEFAKKLSKEMGYEINTGKLDSLIQFLRDNPEYYGYDIPHAKKGIKSGKEKGPRYICVLVDKGRDPYFNKGEEKQVQDGSISQILTVQTSTAHQAAALKYASHYVKDPHTQKQLRRIVRKLEYISEEVGDIYEEIKKNGTL
jgi:hypothetical protein